MIKTIKPYLIWILISIFFFIFSAHSLYNYWSFSAHAWDLGIYDQQTWLFGHFKPQFNTVRGMNLLSDHFGLILFPIGLIYLIYPHAETLLIVQATLVVLSAYPLWIIAKHYLKSNLFGLAIVFVYLSSWGIQSAIDFDFHLATIAVFFYAYFILFMWQKKWLWAGLLAILSMITKEDMPIYIAFAMLGFLTIEIFNPDKENRRKTIIIQSVFFLFSLLFFLLIDWLMTHINPIGRSNYFSFSSFGSSYFEILKNIFSQPVGFAQKLFKQFYENPIKKKAFLVFMNGFSWLPVFAPQTYFAIIPFFLIKFASDRSALWGLSGQYAVKNILHKYENFRKYISYLSIILVIMALKVNFSDGIFEKTFESRKWQLVNQYEGLNKIIKQIPKEASVVTQDQIIPHVSNRQKVFMLKCIYCNLSASNNYEYILIDTRFNIIFNPIIGGDIQPTLKELLNNNTFEGKGNYIIAAKDEQKDYSTYLFKNNN